jgi:serine/threonine protein kinase/type II secretory pathway component GspD/PulD (secretin)
MINYTCPTPDRWTALLGDELPADEQLDMQGHLDNCPECQRVLETCAADRSAWSAVPRWLGSAHADAKLQTAIERLKNSLDDGIGETDMTLDFLDPSERADSLGRLNSYEVIEEIGRGGMGIVLKALDPALHRVVAIKVLAPQLAVSASARKRFTREARAAAAVCHEHVVTIHAVEEFKTLPYLVMHYVAGQSLQQKLDSHGPLPVADILRIGMQAAAGLAAAHAQGLVHRDIKPANILLENGVERVRITDFGLARAIDDVGVTSSGVIAGTPQYMAPEQARGDPLDARADLFSLGSVLYAMCTGEAPFDGSHALDVLRKVGEQQPQPIREVNYEIPTWLEAIVVKLMAKDPSQRFASAAEVAELLERCLAHVQNPSAEPLPASIPHVAAIRRSALSRWAALLLPILAGLFVVTEATGTTHMMKALGTILRFKTPEGTLVVEIDDPAVKVTLDDRDLVITGAGAQEVRLKPGAHTVRAMKDGQTKTEMVSIEKDGRVTVKVSFESGLPPVAKGARPAQPPFVKDLPRFTLEFRNEPWSGVFEGLSKLTELPVIANVKPTGTFTFHSPVADDGRVRQYKLGEVIDIVNEALMQQHFLLVRRSKNFIVMPLDEKLDPSYFANVTSYELEQRGKTELVNYIVRLEHVRAADARATLKELQSPLGMSTTIPGGALSINDKAENVRRIVERLTESDRKRSDMANPFGGNGRPALSESPRVAVEFREEPWTNVFDSLSKLIGLPVVRSGQTPEGKFSLTPKRNVTITELIDLINDTLIEQRFLLVRKQSEILLVRGGEKLNRELYQKVEIAELASLPRSDLVHISFKLQTLGSMGFTLKANHATNALTVFGAFTFPDSTNTVQLYGTAGNLMQVTKLLREADAPPKTPPSPPLKSDERKFSVEMRDQPWSKVFDWLGEISGAPVVHTVTPTGTFTFAAGKRRYSLTEIIDVLNDSLMQQQFLLVRQQNKFKVIPTDEKIDPSLFAQIAIDDLERYGKTELVTVVYKSNRLSSVPDAIPEMLSPFGHWSYTSAPRSLAISDKAENIRRIVALLTELDRLLTPAQNTPQGKKAGPTGNDLPPPKK